MAPVEPRGCGTGLYVYHAHHSCKRLHARFAKACPWSERSRWLDQAADVDTSDDLLAPADEGLLKAHPVSTLVNAPGNDTPECIEPFTAE